MDREIKKWQSDTLRKIFAYPQPPSLEQYNTPYVGEVLIQLKNKYYKTMDRKEAIEVVKKTWPFRSHTRLREALETLAPELKESGDESKKWILEYLYDGLRKSDEQFKDQFKAAIAWLEKQGKPETFKWSEEDETTLNSILSCIIYCKDKDTAAQYNGDPRVDPKRYEPMPDWLKSLKYRVQSAKWSEEDSRILYNVKAYVGYAAGKRGVKEELFEEANEWLNSLPIGFIHNENYNEDMVTLLVGELKQIANNNNVPEQYQAEINWLKSLRPQNWTKEDKERYISCLQRLSTGNPEQPETINSKWFKEHVYPQTTWKPSEEQMWALDVALENFYHPDDRAALESLRTDLQKIF